MTDEQSKDTRDVAAARAPLHQSLNGSDPEYDGILQQMDEVTSAAAKTAKDYRAWMLEHMKANINAALDYTNGIASVSLPHGYSEPAAQEREENAGTPKLKRPLPVPAKAAEEYRAMAFELMISNVNATLEYARRLISVENAGRVHRTVDQPRAQALRTDHDAYRRTRHAVAVVDDKQRRTDDRRHRESVQPEKRLRNGADHGPRQNVFLMPSRDARGHSGRSDNISSKIPPKAVKFIVAPRRREPAKSAE